MTETVKVDPPASLGGSFADALAAKDFDRIRGMLHSEIDFRGLTPRRQWEASDPDAVVGEILREWFEESDEIEELVQVETDSFERDGRIGWMRTLCSGFRPLEDGAGR
jgi:hypothetical protein